MKRPRPWSAATRRSFLGTKAARAARKESGVKPPHAKALAMVLCLCVGPGVARAASGEAERRVEEGLAHYQAADYGAATRAFAQAEAALPNDPRILFDLGATLAAKGDLEQAETVLQKAATSTDREIAARARYNLGCLAAEKARTLFGTRPDEASPKVRQQGMELLDQAAGHYRECLRVDENHADARHNLELIRLWSAQMRSAWRTRDQQDQTGLPVPAKSSPKKTPSQPAPKQSSGHDQKKGKKPEGPEDKKGQTPGDEDREETREGQTKASESDGGEAPQDPAEELFSKVRQRSQQKRAWAKQRAPTLPAGLEEKDW